MAVIERIIYRATPMPRHTEPSANTALANILRGMMHGCNIRSESTQTIAAKWCAEPSVHGGKKRPRNATLII